MKVKFKDGTVKNMKYEDVCHKLGFVPETHFVKITRGGAIGFEIGTPNEIRALYRAIEREGMIPTRGMVTLNAGL